jgi:hypothetical protein
VKGTLGWMFTTWLALIALQTLSTTGASGRVASLFTDVNSVVQRALDPAVPAIPDRRTTTTTVTGATPSPAVVTAAPGKPAASALFQSRFPLLPQSF